MDDETNDIDDLLKALDGIEQCFVTDSKDTEMDDVKKSLSSVEVPAPVNANKRAPDASLSLAPPCKRISLKDPRLRKLCATLPAPAIKEESNIPVINLETLNSSCFTSTGNSVPVNHDRKISQLSIENPIFQLKFSTNDWRRNEGSGQNAQSQVETHLLSEKSSMQEVAISKSESNPKSVSELNIPFGVRATPTTQHNHEKVVNAKNEIPTIQKKLPCVDKSEPNDVKSLRKPEKFSNLPVKKPMKQSNELSRNNLPRRNESLIDKKVADLSHKTQSIFQKSAVSVPGKNSNSGKIPVPGSVDKQPVSQNLIRASGKRDQPIKIIISEPNAKKVTEGAHKNSKLPKKPLEIHRPAGSSNKSIPVSSRIWDVFEKLDSKKIKIDLPVLQNCSEVVKSNTVKPANKTRKRSAICMANSLLPIEMLVKIFKYLSVRDRRNVKLVCKSWYDTCNMKLFMMRHRFVCCGNYDTTSILQTLMNSRCEYFNVEFYRVNFDDNFSKYWKEIGPKIHSLYFVDCVIGEETFGDVIINCTEMEHLSFSFENLKVPSLKLFKLTLFENLYKQRIKRPKVVSFSLQINSNGWFSNAIISNLFAIFPNISRLGFTCHSLDPVENEKEAVPPCDIAFSDLWSSKTLTFSPILEYALSESDSMEKLILDLHTKGRRTGFAWQSIVTYSKLTRLREITIEIDLKKLSGNAVVEFCCNQKELKSVSCKIIGSAKLFISLFVLKLLDSCPRLRNLNISYNAPFLISYELFRGLINSKLKSLSLESPNVLLAPQIVDESTWPINEHLKSLSLSHGVGKILQNLLIVTFCNLKFLEIHNLSDDTLQLIWKFQTNLIGLKLAGVEECTVGGFRGVPKNLSFSIRNLQNLEYLVLEAVDIEWEMDENVFSEFQFPKLRYFCVDIEGSITVYNDLINAMKHFNELEAVSINCSGVQRSTWLELNKNWKKLRYLRFVDKESSKFKVKQYLNFFKTSPNLRALVHEGSSTMESYYYDVLDKTIKKKMHRAKYRISSEKVGNSFIDWLWF